MKRVGISLIIFGAGGLILPLLGLQFRLLNILGTAQNSVPIVALITGIILLVVGVKSDSPGYKRGNVSNMKNSDSNYHATNQVGGSPGSNLRNKMKTCPNCGESVSDKIKSCPGCYQLL